MFAGRILLWTDDVPVAQLDRALASGAKGRRFESCRAHHLIQSRGGRAGSVLGLNQTPPFGTVCPFDSAAQESGG
jgi:hypothetical protein